MNKIRFDVKKYFVNIKNNKIYAKM